MATNVAASIPPMIIVPIAMRLCAPAPVDIAGGMTPKMNANDVIRIVVSSPT
jgi:hypothetical protein